jgi:hypothetical protein
MASMKAMFGIGLVVLLLGVASLFVPVPHREHEGMKVGDVSIGITTHDEETVSPFVSAAMILGGVGLLVAARSQTT